MPAFGEQHDENVASTPIAAKRGRRAYAGSVLVSNDADEPRPEYAGTVLWLTGDQPAPTGNDLHVDTSA